MFLFNEEINDLYSWGAVFQSIKSFKKLIMAIYEKENLKGDYEISNLTPGSNAVFKVDNTVIKIFAPKQSTLNLSDNMNIELKGNEMAKRSKLHSPNIICSGEIEDKYLFQYIIFEYIEGKEIGDIFNNLPLIDKQNIIENMKQALLKFNNKVTIKNNKDFLYNSFCNENRWCELDEKLYNEISEFFKGYQCDYFTYVHGDLTGENILVNCNNELCIIDFADNAISIREYEYAPIFFSSMNYDLEGIKIFFKNKTNKEISEKLFLSLLIHEYGLNYIKNFLKIKKLEIKNLKSIFDVKEIIYEDLQAFENKIS